MNFSLISVLIKLLPNFGSIGGSLQNTNLPNIDFKYPFLDLNEAKNNILAVNIHLVKIFITLAILINAINSYVVYLEFGGFLLFLYCFIYCFDGLGELLFV